VVFAEEQLAELALLRLVAVRPRRAWHVVDDADVPRDLVRRDLAAAVGRI